MRHESICNWNAHVAHFSPRGGANQNIKSGGEIAMRSEVDISGIPLFYVNKIISMKMDDGNVMVICGIKRGTEFTPLYATVSPISVALTDGKEYVELAEMSGETSH